MSKRSHFNRIQHTTNHDDANCSSGKETPTNNGSYVVSTSSMDLLLKLAKYTSTWIPFPTLSRTLVFPSVGPRLAPNDPNSLHLHSESPGPPCPSAAPSKCRRKCQVCLLRTGNTIRHHHQKIDSRKYSFPTIPDQSKYGMDK